MSAATPEAGDWAARRVVCGIVGEETRLSLHDGDKNTASKNLPEVVSRCGVRGFFRGDFNGLLNRTRMLPVIHLTEPLFTRGSRERNLVEPICCCCCFLF
ncbi:hypothetical protein J6590_032249 [Homalodisca vitripennis]|nr:hypothetical protein J6590_032249 [Homalodisca vitripennis]